MDLCEVDCCLREEWEEIGTVLIEVRSDEEIPKSRRTEGKAELTNEGRAKMREEADQARIDANYPLKSTLTVLVG